MRGAEMRAKNTSFGALRPKAVGSHEARSARHLVDWSAASHAVALPVRSLSSRGLTALGQWACVHATVGGGRRTAWRRARRCARCSIRMRM